MMSIAYWLAACAAVMICCLNSVVAHSDERPNVLFIAVDDLTCALGCYGDLIAKTPNIDRLAASGVCFERAFNQIPLCNPSRASVMTGLRPDKTTVYDLGRHFRDQLPDVVTLPQAFQQADYFAARVGKIYHYDVPTAIGTEGFDDPPSWNQTINPLGRDKTDEAQVFNAEPQRKISGSLSWLAAEGLDGEQTDGLIATAAIKLMQEHRNGPFFLGVGFFRPHTPFVAPKRYFDLYPVETLRLPYSPYGDRDDIPVAAFAHNNPLPNYNLDHDTLLKATQAYYACVSFVDAQVGRLWDAIVELDIADKTIVVLWSDHGYHLGEHHGVWQKRTLFEQAARAPLIICAPEQQGRGPCRRVVEFVDIYPTLTDLAGVVSPPGLDGRSLRPLLNDPLAAWDGSAVTQILRPADDRLAEPVMGLSLRTERYRFTQWGEGKHGVELYDHQIDPSEFNNLAIDPDVYARELMLQLKPMLRAKASGTTPRTPFDPARL